MGFSLKEKNVKCMVEFLFLFLQEWVGKQEAMKNEEIEITFSYWDGSGHRRSVRMKKGEFREGRRRLDIKEIDKLLPPLFFPSLLSLSSSFSHLPPPQLFYFFSLLVLLFVCKRCIQVNTI